ncbi:hypothetical protein EYF80_019355 [Liparis tanakae]|uniref:Uncharacterized protein n=1 Tax=Liparis tanakae TaxID=230148 RepID=A0A4Z2HXT9_9TELE|nr:hypothetical protein EYF80_019355 [Liparis tanakae]
MSCFDLTDNLKVLQHRRIVIHVSKADVHRGPTHQRSRGGLDHDDVLGFSLVIQVCERGEVAVKDVQLENLRNIPFYDLVHDLSIGALVGVGGGDPGHDGPHRAVLLHVDEQHVLLEHRSVVVYVLDDHVDGNGRLQRGNPPVHSVGLQVVDGNILPVQFASSSDDARVRLDIEIPLSVIAALKRIAHPAVGARVSI